MFARVIRDTTLENGLQVIAIENHQAPLTTVEVVVHTGAFTQDHGQEGVPHSVRAHAVQGVQRTTW